MTLPIPSNRYPIPSYGYDVSLGNVTSVVPYFLVGVRDNQSIASGSITLWDAGEAEGSSGNIVFLLDDADIYLASTNAGDTNVVVLVRGMTTEYVFLSQAITLNGQTPVQLSTQLRYVLQAFCTGAGDAPLGDIYINAGSAFTAGVPDDVTLIQSKILSQYRITHNGFTVVPKGKGGVVLSVRGTTNASDKPAEITSWIWQTQSTFPVMAVKYSVSPAFAGFSFPVSPSLSFFAEGSIDFPEGTIIEFKSSAISNNTNVFFGQDYTFEPTSHFNQ